MGAMTKEALLQYKDKLEQDIAKSDKYLELYEQHKGECIDAK